MASLFLTAFCAALLTLSGWLHPASLAARPRPGTPPPELTAGTALDFDACARLAIRQSPYLTKSEVEIDIRRLAETDSKADFLPSVNFRSRYYVSDLSRTGFHPSPYSLEFVSEPYSPVDAYFSLQVRKLLTKIARLHHLQAIAEGLQRLGRSFLELAAQQQLAQNQAEYLAIAAKHLLYTQTRQNLGSADQLELKIAAQEVEVAQLSQQQLAASRQKYVDGIKAYLGWPPQQELRLELNSARSQVLGNLEAGSADTPETRPATVDLQIQAVKKELQRYNITLAKTKLLPTFFAGVQTPDPLANVQTRSLFFFVGASLPVWDGGKRLRNVSRQKAILSQQEAEGQEKELDFQAKFQEARLQVADAAAQLKLSHSQLELAELKRRQQEIRYQQLGESLSTYLDSEKGLVAAKKKVILKTLEYDLARLQLHHLANNLVGRYVAATPKGGQ